MILDFLGICLGVLILSFAFYIVADAVRHYRSAKRNW